MNIKEKVLRLFEIEKEGKLILDEIKPLLEKYSDSFGARYSPEDININDNYISWSVQTCACCNDPEYYSVDINYFDDPDAYIAKEKQKKLDQEAAEQLEKQKAREDYERAEFERLKKKLNL